MQGRGDVPQEVEARHEERRQKESCEEYGPERCRLDKLRRRRRKMNLSEGGWGRGRDETPCPAYRQSHPSPPIILEPPKPPIPLEPPMPKIEEGPSYPSGSGRRGGRTEDVLGAAANEGGIEDARVAAATEGGSCPREEARAGAPTGG